MISLIMAAATMVPDMIDASEGSIGVKVAEAIPVKTNDTPECGKSVKPKYFVTAGAAFVIFPPKNALPIFPADRERM